MLVDGVLLGAGAGEVNDFGVVVGVLLFDLFIPVLVG